MGSGTSRNKHVELKDINVTCEEACRLCGNTRTQFAEDFIVDCICDCKDHVHMSCIMNQIADKNSIYCDYCERQYHWECLEKFPEYNKENCIDAVVLTDYYKKTCFNSGWKQASLSKSKDPPLEKIKETLKILNKGNILETHTFIGHYYAKDFNMDYEYTKHIAILYPNGYYNYVYECKATEIGPIKLAYASTSNLFVLMTCSKNVIHSITVYHEKKNLARILDIRDRTSLVYLYKKVPSVFDREYRVGKFIESKMGTLVLEPITNTNTVLDLAIPNIKTTIEQLIIMAAFCNKETFYRYTKRYVLIQKFTKHFQEIQTKKIKQIMEKQIETCTF